MSRVSLIKDAVGTILLRGDRDVRESVEGCSERRGRLQAMNGGGRKIKPTLAVISHVA